MARTLRAMVSSGETVTAPGVGDALGALLVREAGFPALSLSGYYMAATMGYPDVGLITMTELVERTALICTAAQIPVIADADNGYGNAVNVMRTVSELERAGAEAIVLEDQVSPKKCGGLPGIDLITAEEMCGKLRAALHARRSRDTLIIARTDALHTSAGMTEAVRRARLYCEMGADMIFAHGLDSVADMKTFRAGVDGPLMAGIGTHKDVAVKELEAIGYRTIIYSLTMLRCGMVAMRGALKALREDGVLDHRSPAFAAMPDVHRFLGVERVRSLEQQFAGPGGEATKG